MHGEEDSETSDGDADGEYGEEKSVPDFVREVGDYHCEAECGGPGGDGVDLMEGENC